MPSMESSLIVRRKQEESCGRGVAALNMVGEACVKSFSDIMLYVSMASSMSSPWMPTATRISMCCGRSTTFPSILSR